MRFLRAVCVLILLVMVAAFVFPRQAGLAAPSNLTAAPVTVSNSKISLGWQDNSADESYFCIERKTGATGTWAQVAVVPANTTSYVNTLLTPNTNYAYRVRANNTTTNSAFSNEATATTNVLGAPSNLSATPYSNDRVILAWADNSAEESFFRIERKTEATGTWAQVAVVPANTTTYVNTMLTGSTNYVFRIRANNASGNSPFSNEAACDTRPPAYLQSITVENDLLELGATTTCTVTFSSNLSSARTVTLQSSIAAVQLPATVTVSAGASTATFAISLNQAPAPVLASVSATSDGWTQQAPILCTPSVAALAPTEMAVSAGAGGVWVDWSEGTNEGLGVRGAKGYAVFRRQPDGAFERVNATAVSGNAYFDSNVPAGEWTYRVDIVSEAGTSIASTSSAAVVVTPSAPTITWQTVPDPTESADIVFQFSAPPNDDLNCYIDGQYYTTVPTDDRPGPNYALTIDSRELSNGPHTIIIASSEEGERNSSAPLSFNVANTISQLACDGIVNLDLGQLCNFYAKLPLANRLYTVNLLDEAGAIVRTWTGHGVDARITWDGMAANGSPMADGDYELEVVSGDERSGGVSVIRVGNRPKFLSLVEKPDDAPAVGEGVSADFARLQLAHYQELR